MLNLFLGFCCKFLVFHSLQITHNASLSKNPRLLQLWTKISFFKLRLEFGQKLRFTGSIGFHGIKTVVQDWIKTNKQRMKRL